MSVRTFTSKGTIFNDTGSLLLKRRLNTSKSGLSRVGNDRANFKSSKYLSKGSIEMTKFTVFASFVGISEGIPELFSKSDCRILRAVSIPISPKDSDPPEVKPFRVGIPRLEISTKRLDISESFNSVSWRNADSADLTAILIPSVS